MQSKPPSDLVAVLGDHFALNADRYGLDADALRLERVYGSGVRRSFRVHDDDNSIHVKLWPATRRSVWEQWFAVREVLESRYQAPRIMGLVDLPDIAMGGLVFEHIEGMPPVSGSYTGLLLDLALRLHADRELASRIGLLRGAETVGQYFERTGLLGGGTSRIRLHARQGTRPKNRIYSQRRLVSTLNGGFYDPLKRHLHSEVGYRHRYHPGRVSAFGLGCPLGMDGARDAEARTNGEGFGCFRRTSPVADAW